MAAVGGKPGIEFLLLLLPERAFGRPDRPGGRPGVDVSPISRTCAHAFFHSLRPPAPASLPRKPAAVPWRDASRPYFQRSPYARRYGAARSPGTFSTRTPREIGRASCRERVCQYV